MAAEVRTVTKDSCETWNAFIFALRESFVHFEHLHCIVCYRSLCARRKRSNRTDLGELTRFLTGKGIDVSSFSFSLKRLDPN